MTRGKNRVKVWKHPTGVFVWDCRLERCGEEDVKRRGASMHWEIAQLQADEHARDWHHPERHVSRDMPTPPGGTRFDWSDTGYHVRVVD